jgi:DNA-entry nuclease
MFKPSGWHTVKYPELIDDLYLYNRCHLIGWQLGNENANEKNLITGTRYLNVTGMLPYENMVADYVRNTGNHVLYRVTPYFAGNDLVARGILMEAESVEDTGISFCIWCYNVQPGILIDYATGNSVADPNAAVQLTAPAASPTAAALQITAPPQASVSVHAECTYILNTNTKRIHLPTCSSVNEMKPSNRQEFSGDVSGLLEQGYKACGRCHPF